MQTTTNCCNVSVQSLDKYWLKAMHLIVRAFLLANIDNILNEVVIQDVQLIVSEAKEAGGGEVGAKHECGENLDEHCWEKLAECTLHRLGESISPLLYFGC